MNLDARQYLATLLEKHITSLTEHDIAFIKARFSYLDEEQQAIYRSVVGLETAVVDLMDLKRPELDQMAVELELDPTEYKNKKELVSAIKEAQEASQE